MELSQILERMEQKASKSASAKIEKTAAVSTPAEATLKQALNEILKASGGTEKTASAPRMSPQEALMKQAELLVGSEKQAEVEHAKILGLAFADAAITKWAAYDAQLKHFAAQEEKSAAAGYYQTRKIAEGEMDYASMPPEQVQALAEQGDPGAIAFLQQMMGQAGQGGDPGAMEGKSAAEMYSIKVAASQGNPQAINYLNKLAAAEYEQGQSQALNEIYQTAASEFLKGAAETNILLQQLKAQG